MLLLVPATTSAAAPSDSPSPASGALTATITASSPTASGNNTNIYDMEADAYNGTLVGTSVGSGLAVIHSDGSANAWSVKTFNGTIAGSAPGTLTTYTTCAATATGALTCVYVMDHGTGGLAGVRVKGTQTGSFTGPNTVAFTYNALIFWSNAHSKWSASSTQGASGQASITSGTSSAAAHHGWWSRTITVPGTAALTNTVTISDYDNNTITYFLFAANRTGGMVGPAVGSGMFVLRPDGTAVDVDTGTFTGTILGSAPGTIQFAGVQTGTLTYLAGHIALFRGTGGLAGIRGYGPETLDAATGVFNDTVHVWFGR